MHNFYSRTCRSLSPGLNRVKRLDLSTIQPHNVYYLHLYDILHRGLTLDTAIDDVHWRHLSVDKTSAFLYDAHNENFNWKLGIELQALLNNKRFSPEQLYIFVTDSIHKTFLDQQLNQLGIYGAHILNLRSSLKETALVDIFSNITPTHRFSCLSRNYRVERLQFFCELNLLGLLDQFLYSFHNIHPYGEITTFPITQLALDLKAVGIDPYKEPTSSWLAGVPYSLGSNDVVQNKFHNITYQTILESQFNIVIETHFDLQEYNSGTPYPQKDLVPHVTEKTYKAISCSRPFIIVGTPGILDAVRQLGYKSFAPYIDETYDTIEDNDLRMRALVNEVARLSRLTNSELEQLQADLQPIVEFNLNLFKYQRKLQLPPEYAFLYEYTIPS